LLGGDSYGNATLSRFFALHAFVLPTAVGLMALVHVGLYLKHGPSRPNPDPRPARPYFPYQLLRDLVLMLLVFATLAALALLLGAPLEAPADPASDYEARPEWYFLFLYQLLQFFEGPLVILGTTILPALAALFLLAIPFIDRKRRRGLEAVPSAPVKLGYLGLLAVIGGLTVYALVKDLSDEGFQKSRARSEKAAERAIALADQGGVDGLGRVILLAGLELYHDKGCAGCHDDPDAPAPRLKGYATLERAAAFLADPNGARFFKGTPLAEEMDPTGLAPEDDLAIAAWLMGRKDVPPDRLERGRKLFLSEECTTCHNDPLLGPRHKSWDFRATGPDLAGWLSYGWVRGLLVDASHPSYFGDALSEAELEDAMPAYPELTPDELDLLTTWLLAGAPEAEL
jgi:ubiquinol-cytochrome c reductase cytochrome b subunit